MVTFAFSSEIRHILVSGPRLERASGQSKYIMEKENLQSVMLYSVVPYLNNMVSAIIYVLQITLRKSYC